MITRILTVFSIFLFVLAISATAQAKRPTPRPTPRPTTPPRVTISPIVAAAKQQVANQLSNVNLFVDKMGPIAVAIEAIDRDSKKHKKEVVDANEANKKKLVEAIRGMRAGLVSLETDFRTKPQLTKYLPHIRGISDMCARSEDSAIAGQFVASKDPLRQVAQKLSDTMAVLPR